MKLGKKKKGSSVRSASDAGSTYGGNDGKSDEEGEDVVLATKMTGEATCNPVWQEKLAIEVDTGYVGIDSQC